MLTPEQHASVTTAVIKNHYLQFMINISLGENPATDST